MGLMAQTEAGLCSSIGGINSSWRNCSAKMLGKGSLGTVYKAVLDDGYSVAVKRLKDTNPYTRNEFEQYMDIVGKVKHPNIVRFRAYYYAKEEKLLVYDYLLLGGYKAPEQEQVKRLSQQAELYSFRVLLLEVLTGRAPSQHPSSARPRSDEHEQDVDLPKWVRSVTVNLGVLIQTTALIYMVALYLGFLAGFDFEGLWFIGSSRIMYGGDVVCVRKKEGKN